MTVMIVPGSWHSTDDDFLEEPAEIEGKDLMPWGCKHIKIL